MDSSLRNIFLILSFPVCKSGRLQHPCFIPKAHLRSKDFFILSSPIYPFLVQVLSGMPAEASTQAAEDPLFYSSWVPACCRQVVRNDVLITYFLSKKNFSGVYIDLIIFLDLLPVLYPQLSKPGKPDNYSSLRLRASKSHSHGYPELLPRSLTLFGKSENPLRLW